MNAQSSVNSNWPNHFCLEVIQFCPHHRFTPFCNLIRHQLLQASDGSAQSDITRVFDHMAYTQVTVADGYRWRTVIIGLIIDVWHSKFSGLSQSGPLWARIFILPIDIFWCRRGHYKTIDEFTCTYIHLTNLFKSCRGFSFIRGHWLKHVYIFDYFKNEINMIIYSVFHPCSHHIYIFNWKGGFFIKLSFLFFFNFEIYFSTGQTQHISFSYVFGYHIHVTIHAIFLNDMMIFFLASSS